MSEPLPPTPIGGQTPITCPTCGGSGVLRLNHHRFRTCLDCVGQGVLPQFTGQAGLEEEILRRQSGEAISETAASAFSR